MSEMENNNLNNDNNIEVKKKIYYTPAQKRANYKYNANNRQKINEIAKNWYNNHKDTEEFKQKKKEYNRRYLEKQKLLKQQT